MKRWTVVLKTQGHQNGTGEHPFAVRAGSRAEAVEKAQEAFRVKDCQRHKPTSQRRVHAPDVKEVFCWDLVS
jgi:hypothetical protein